MIGLTNKNSNIIEKIKTMFINNNKQKAKLINYLNKKIIKIYLNPISNKRKSIRVNKLRLINFEKKVKDTKMDKIAKIKNLVEKVLKNNLIHLKGLKLQLSQIISLII